MKTLGLFTAILMSFSVAHGEDFTGSWVVVDVLTSKEFPWHEEIKYPKSFVIEIRDSKLVGHYEDQRGYECDFELLEVVNDGHELLLGHCGGTKSPSSWAPIHKV